MALLLVSERVLNRASFRCLGVGVEWGVAGVQKMGDTFLISTALDVQRGQGGLCDMMDCMGKVWGKVGELITD